MTAIELLGRPADDGGQAADADRQAEDDARRGRGLLGDGRARARTRWQAS